MPKPKFDMHYEIDKVALTLSRLNSDWSFTGGTLAYAADIYLRPNQGDELDRVLDLVQAYAWMSRITINLAEDGWVIPAEWNRLFGKMGQHIFFYLPEALPRKLEKDFEKEYKKKFAKAWRESPSPPVMSTSIRKISL